MKKSASLTIGSILTLLLSACGSEPTMKADLSQVTIENSLLVPADLPDMKFVATYAPGQKIPPLSDSIDPENFGDVDFRKCTDVFSPIYLSPYNVPNSKSWAWTVMYDESNEDQAVLVSQFLRIADSKYAQIIEEVTTNQPVCKDFKIGDTGVTVNQLDIGNFGDSTLAYNLSFEHEEYAESEPNYTVVVIGYGQNFLTAFMDLNKGFSVSKVAKIAEIMDGKFRKMSALQK